MDIKINKFIFFPCLFLMLAIGMFAGFVVKDQIFSGEIGEFDKNEISVKTLDFIDSNFLNAQGLSASIVSLEEENGVYKIEFQAGENQITSFVTKDGKYLFPQALDMIPEISEIPKTNKPNVKLFAMSFCPFGTQAEQILNPLANLLKDKIDFELAYIISKNGDEFSSLHGEEELNQNVREMCVSKYYPDKFWNFVSEINNSCTIEDIDNCWQNSAKELGIDLNEIEACKNTEAEDFLNRQLALNQTSFKVQDSSRHNGSSEDFIYSSPTLIINDFIFDGTRNIVGYKKAICSAFIERPAECDQEINQEINEVQGGCGS